MKASEIFGAVDPHLTVINRSHRRRSSKPMTNKDWEKARGDICPGCGNDSLRFHNGICMECNNKKDLTDAREMERIAKYKHLFEITRDRRRAAKK